MGTVFSATSEVRSNHGQGIVPSVADIEFLLVRIERHAEGLFSHLDVLNNPVLPDIDHKDFVAVFASDKKTLPIFTYGQLNRRFILIIFRHGVQAALAAIRGALPGVHGQAE